MQKILLNGEWNLKLDSEQNGLAENWAANPILPEYKLNIPGSVQQLDELSTEYPPVHDMRNSYKGTFFLEKIVTIPMLKSGEHCRLYLGGVAPSCHIWINGNYVAKNIFGVCRVVQDITSFVTNGENRITVAVVEQYASLITGMRFNGVEWSGIYSESFIEIGGALHIENAYISYKNGEAFAQGRIINNSNVNVKSNVLVSLGKSRAAQKVSVAAGEFTDFSVLINTNGLPCWSYREPNLVKAEFVCDDINGIKSKISFNTGIREICCKNNKILINNKPTFLKGTGSEYFSPTISPLTDTDILTNRYKAIKKYGFNFFRCHTHVPTEEEMRIADQMGVMLCVEFGLVSNFNKTTPIELGLLMWEKFILQSRNHPSVIVYCIGNEGSQLMVDSIIERNRAKIGYKTIKQNTTNQLGIIAFGMQGELSELPNDFETPHLWSENFLWAYDGLTDIPWNELGETTNNKPCVIHEYGKFGVWPSRKEEAETTVEHGIKPSFATQSYNWLKANNLENLENVLIQNSRKSANSFNRIILEDARKQPYVSGYALWTFFRRTDSNAGLSDDLGINLNGETELFANGCNSEIALLMDRGFQNRAFECGVKQSISITVSNFSTDSVEGTLTASISCNNTEISAFSNICKAEMGEMVKQFNFVFTVPTKYADKKLTLSAKLDSNCKTVSENSWELWAFDTSASDTVVYLNISNMPLFRSLKKVFPKAQRLSSVDSVIIGCRSWRDPKISETAAKFKNVLIISDIYNNEIKQCIKNGNKVLLLDSGNLPEEWFLPPICKELGDRDTGRFYTSFRAGWDKGNLVTLVETDKLLGTFPTESYCNLHFYDMMQSSRILKPEVVESEMGSSCKKIVASVSKLPPKAVTEVIVQDPNAIKEQTNTNQNNFNARLQGYLLKFNNSVAVCTLKLADNPAGIGLIKNIVKNI